MKKIFAQTLAVALMLGVSTAAFAGHWEAKDANKDGQISKAEAQAHHDKKFDKMDANKDGQISKAERDAAKAEWKAKHKEHMKK